MLLAAMDGLPWAFARLWAFRSLKSRRELSESSGEGDLEQLVDAKEAARLLAVSTGLIKKLAREGRIRRLKIGRSARYAVSDLERLVGLDQSV